MRKKKSEPEVKTISIRTSHKPVRAKHSCNPGDLIACMAAMKAYYELTFEEKQISLD